MTKRIGLIFGLLFILFSIFQISLYGRYAAEATYIYVKDSLGRVTFDEQKKLGAICNSLGRISCSIKLFTKLAKKYSTDSEILSNLAMSLTMGERAREADPYYRAYFAGGGNALETMHWYGKALASLGRDNEAITWFYNVLYHQDVEASKISELNTSQILLNLLVSNRRPTEAASLIGALLQKNNNASQSKILREQLLHLKSEPTENEIHLPALDGRIFYIPISLRNGQIQFVEAHEDVATSFFNAADAASLGLDEKKIRQGRVIVNNLKIGALSVQNAELQICMSCQSSLGSKVLSQLKARIDERGKVPYLILEKGE